MRDRLKTSTHTWRAIASLALCAIGVALSSYTLWVHYRPSALVCVSAGSIDCQAVLTSAQSVIVGIPVPYFGIVFFVALGGLCLPAAWVSTEAWVHLVRLAAVIIGMGSAIYLIVTELFTVKKICLWCTGVHVVTFAVFVIVVTATPAIMARSGSSLPDHAAELDDPSIRHLTQRQRSEQNTS